MLCHLETSEDPICLSEIVLIHLWAFQGTFQILEGESRKKAEGLTVYCSSSCQNTSPKKSLFLTKGLMCSCFWSRNLLSFLLMSGEKHKITGKKEGERGFPSTLKLLVRAQRNQAGCPTPTKDLSLFYYYSVKSLFTLHFARETGYPRTSGNTYKAHIDILRCWNLRKLCVF